MGQIWALTWGVGSQSRVVVGTVAVICRVTGRQQSPAVGICRGQQMHNVAIRRHMHTKETEEPWPFPS